MKNKKKVIWDYDISKMNFDDPEVIKWHLKRKIDFCDWEGLDKKMLMKYLPELDIDPAMKHLLELFLQHENSPNSFSKKVPQSVRKN